MNRFFTLLLAVSCLTAVGQVPDYVPADGLVAWWNMFENGLDSSPNQIHPINEGFQAGLDRFGNDAGCFDSEGTHIDYGTHPEFYNESFSFSAWINPNSAPTQRTFMGYHRDQTGGATLGLIPSNQIKFHTNVLGYGSTGEQGVVSSSPLQANVWTSVVGTYSMGLLSLYLNGVLDTQLEGVLPPTYSDNNFFQVGKWTGGDQFFGGLIDDVGVWNRALSDAEVLELYLASAPKEGCTDHEACNYDADAIFDDGTCYDCDIPASHCGVGTVWDAETQTCIVANPADINLDGCVQLNDLLDLLSAYGMCFVWQCGDLVDYQGYDYETVQIGEQCWFAENLRAEYYQNNDPLASDLSDEEWSSISIGAQSFYEYNSEILADYGRLYNGYAVLDEREICPSGWHVPTDNEFMALEVHLGMSPSEVNYSGWRGTNEGEKLKSSPSDDPAWNGNNASGFGAAAGGMRFGTFYYQGAIGSFWTAEGIYCRELHVNDQIFRDPNNNLIDGFSVRCIKDTE